MTTFIFLLTQIESSFEIKIFKWGVQFQAQIKAGVKLFSLSLISMTQWVNNENIGQIYSGMCMN